MAATMEGIGVNDQRPHTTCAGTWLAGGAWRRNREPHAHRDRGCSPHSRRCKHLSAHELGATLPIANWPTTGSAHPGPPAALYLCNFTVCLMDPKLDLPADASLPETTGHGVGSAPDRRSGRPDRLPDNQNPPSVATIVAPIRIPAIAPVPKPAEPAGILVSVTRRKSTESSGS